MEPNFDKYPFGSPSRDFCKLHGYNELEELPDEVSNRDFLIAILNMSDALFHELSEIRKHLERK